MAIRAPDGANNHNVTNLYLSRNLRAWYQRSSTGPCDHDDVDKKTLKTKKFKPATISDLPRGPDGPPLFTAHGPAEEYL